MQWTERERVALGLAMRYPGQIITEGDVDAEMRRLHLVSY